MKKLMAALIAVGLLAGTASAQEVLSRNAVGYVKVEVPGNALDLVSTPFVNFDGSEQTVEDIFGDGIPTGSIVHIWDANSSTYETLTYAPGFGGWIDEDFVDANNLVVGRGQGFWFENSQASGVDLFIMGEVPDEDVGDEQIDLVEGLSIVSFAFPVEIDLSDPLANLTPTPGDIVHVWNASSSTYETLTYAPGFGGWIDEDFTLVSIISIPGKSFWYETSSANTWTNVRPYTWP